LCFCFRCFVTSGSRRVAGGAPTRSRAISLMIFTAKRFFFFPATLPARSIMQ